MSKKEFFPEIETLRAIAVIMVMLAHFIPKDHPYYVPYLWYGVDLFFTISGFLITYILLGQVHEEQGKSRGVIIKNFFVRRVLRLFPVYYAFIGFFFILRNVFSIYIWTNDYNLYFFTYLQNMYFFFNGGLNTSFSHLWTLGVEEQFYFLWPFILAFIPKRHLLPVFSVFVLFSLGFNLLSLNKIESFRILTIANFHTLGIGAILAYLHYFSKESKLYKVMDHYGIYLFAFAITSLFFSLNIFRSDTHIKVGLVEILLMLTTSTAVQLSISGWPKYFDWLFKNTYIHHVGKVSYGIYLFHMLIPVVLTVVIGKLPFLDFLLPDIMWLRVLLLMSYSYSLAVVSYYFFERYFLKLKVKYS